MEVRFNTEVVEFKGSNHHLDDGRGEGQEDWRECKNCRCQEYLSSLVYRPIAAHFEILSKLDAQGFILTGIDFQTSTEGIFAAGDVRSGSTKQLVSAAGEGAAVALSIREHLRGHDANTMEKALGGSQRIEECQQQKVSGSSRMAEPETFLLYCKCS